MSCLCSPARLSVRQHGAWPLRSGAGFRSTVDACADSLHPQLGLDLRTLIFPDEEATEEATSRLQQTALAQPALFVIEYALAGSICRGVCGLAP